MEKYIIRCIFCWLIRFEICTTCILYMYIFSISLQLIVATEQEELGRLDELLERAKINNVPDVTMIPGDKIKDIEPHCQV